MRVISRRAIPSPSRAMRVATEARLGGAEDEGVEALRRELQAMKRRLAEVDDQTRKTIAQKTSVRFSECESSVGSVDRPNGDHP
jgi:hypothetical protein